MSEYRPTILVFCHISNPRGITGAEKLLLFFCQQLSTYARCIMVFPQEGMATSAARRKGLEIVVLEYPLLYGIYTPYQGLLEDAANLQKDPAYSKLLQLMAGLQPDLVLVNTCVNLLPAVAAKAYGIPVIWKITEIITNSANTPFSLQLIHQYSDWIVTISQAASWCFGGRNNVTIMPPSFDEQSMPDNKLLQELRLGWRREHQLEPEHRCIGYISSYIYRDKGLLPFINMAIAISPDHPEARFLVIGSSVDKDYYNACIARVNRSGYASRFIFIPFVEQVQKAYSMMDVLVVPSIIKEGFGMTAMEGMLYRKPVIAFSSGGLIELMQQTGNAGWLVDPKDHAGLVTKSRFLAAHPIEADMLGELNQERIIAAYGPQAYQQRMANMVQQWRALHPEWFAPSSREFRLAEALVASGEQVSIQGEVQPELADTPEVVVDNSRNTTHPGAAIAHSTEAPSDRTGSESDATYSPSSPSHLQPNIPSMDSAPDSLSSDSTLSPPPPTATPILANRRAGRRRKSRAEARQRKGKKRRSRGKLKRGIKNKRGKGTLGRRKQGQTLRRKRIKRKGNGR